ncbi:MAG: AAA family ATPase [Cyanothece sp. SIO1E1]|nr:AAA family ATPase [Cyanothece sp. SIO1E1]
MIAAYTSGQLTHDHERGLETLARAINLSEGQFSILLARCNYAALRENLVQRLLAACPIQIQHLSLPKSAETLYPAIKAAAEHDAPTALMVFGLEAVDNLDALLTATNQVREEFRKHFSFPLIIWINDDVLQKLIKLAPDFESWSTTIGFAIAPNELMQLIEHTADDVFTKLLDAGAGIFLDNAALHLEKGSPHRTELEVAKKELQNQGIKLDPELEANLEFVLGRNADNSKDESRLHYQRSLELWQRRGRERKESGNLLSFLPTPPSPKSLERQGCLLYCLGLWWRTYAMRHRVEHAQACEQARDYFQQCIDAFEQARRPDLVAKFINALGGILQRLQEWDALEAVAKKALVLHRAYPEPFRLARIYGFLAEVALAKAAAKEARQWAEKALRILARAQTSSSVPCPSEQQSAHLTWEFSYHKGWYLFSLARAQQQLGQRKKTLKTLETAIAATAPQYDPELYIQILAALRQGYFEQGEYLTAFQFKQEQKRVEGKFGFRAFVGADRLQPQQQVVNPALPPVELPGGIAQEIAVSGRQQDVDRLIQRISRNDHKLTVIHGQSGVGKSSLVQAGLIPALQHQTIGTRCVVPILQRVYADWMTVLERALAEALTANGEPQRARDAGTATRDPLIPSRALALDNLMPHTSRLAPILKQLRQNADNHLLSVLIFDQFEEFIFIYKDPLQRRIFYRFLQHCLEIPYVKVMLSLREDYLHYLLECNRLADLAVINNNILDKNILYFVGNLSPADAKSVVKSLTQKNQVSLEPQLIEKLVQDLAETMGYVRPIELQVVGAQLQAENITTLAKYEQSGPQSVLIKRFLEEIIQGCGAENEEIARLVLHLLTDENGNRPLKTRTELTADLSSLVKPGQLDLVLKILVRSGLVFILPETPVERYQLVHDYLVAFSRQEQNLLAELKRRQAEIEKLRQERWRLRAAIAAGVALAILSLSTGLLALRAEFQRQLAEEFAAQAEESAKRAERQRKQAAINEIKAHAVSSEALLAGDRPLDALIESLIAGTQLKQHSPWAEADVQAQVVSALRQTVYGIQEQNRLESHEGSVLSVGFSSDGQTIASAGADHTIKLWRPDGDLLLTLSGHRDVISRVSFSPSGQTIASASLDGTIKLWRPDGTWLKTLAAHPNGALSVNFSPDGETLVSAGADQTIKLWTLDGKLIQRLQGHQNGIRDVSFSPDGQIIASASLDGTIKLWQVNQEASSAELEPLLHTLEGHTDRVISVSFSPDGETIASASLDDTVKLWRLDGTLITTFKGHQDDVLDVSFSPDGGTIASASKDGTLKLWHRNGTLKTTLKGHQYWVYSLSFSPDGQTIASASGDRTIRLWNLNPVGPTVLKGHPDRVNNLSFSPDGQMIASASDDHTVKLWQPDGQLVTTLMGHSQPVGSVDFSPDGQKLASASADKTVKLWKRNGELLTTLAGAQGHTDRVLSANFSPDGQTLASASWDTTIKLWHHDGKLIKTIRGHGRPVNWVSFSPDGETLASASDDKTIKLWSQNSEALRTLRGHEKSVYWVGFSPDGQMLASASDDNTVKLWSLEGEELATLQGHFDRVYNASFSPDGQMLASASRDGTVKLWTSKGVLLHIIQGHDAPVNWVSFNPDGHALASASDDKTIILWDLDDLELDNLLARGCNWVRAYLKHNRKMSESLCEF